jgi:PAS domain S-box-containing protein
MSNEQSERGEKPQGAMIQLQPFEVAVLEIVPDAMVVTNRSGTIVFANPQTERMFGYLKNELLGMKLETLLPERFRKKHRDQSSGFFAKPKMRAMGSGLELSGLKKDGTEFPVEISLNSFQAGEEVVAIAAIRDISDRKRAEEQLRQKIKELADFKSALDEHSILAITDRQGRITYVNEKFCTISKYSREELLGEDHRIINSGFHPKEFWREAWTTIGSGKVWKGRVRNRAKDGSFYWVNATIHPFLDERGKPFQYLAIRTEITEQVRAEEEREALILELRNALAEVKTLGGLLPICCKCKKVRDDKGYWDQIEDYIARHTDAAFSHGYCPECIQTAYEDAGIPVPDEYLKKKPQT